MTLRDYTIRRLGPGDVDPFRQMLTCFAIGFEDEANYVTNPPSDAYIADRLADGGFIPLVAEERGEVIGALCAYVMQKFEQERAEIYVYDLAVLPDHQRKGVATGLFTALKPISREAGAWVIYVQTDHDSEPAIALYTGLGTREDVLHFDIPVE
ncbi:MAG: GNAT family N-acetyltransferase [Pseudomonadota bacterium]